MLYFTGIIGAIGILIPFVNPTSVNSTGLLEQYYYLRILSSIPGFLCFSFFFVEILIPAVCYIVHAIVCKFYRRVGSSDRPTK